MTELSFLITLLLEHKLPKVTRDAVAMRLKDVEAALSANGRSSVVAPPKPQIQIPAHLAGQSPSTIAAMMRHEQMTNAHIAPDGTIQKTDPALPMEATILPKADSQPVAVVAQTPAAAAAMNSRQAALNLAATGKPAPGETKPRKW